MLTDLRIKNLAIIEEQTISFGAGLNVLSGETGSGKSIVLHALELVLGRKASPQLIRSGAAGLEVEAAFDLSAVDGAISATLPDVARECLDEGGELVITRTVPREGKGKVYVNGRLGTVSLLEEIGGALINICGQTQAVRLLDPRSHIDLVDDLAGGEELRATYRAAFGKLRDLRAREEELSLRVSSFDAQRAELEESVRELSLLKLRPGIRRELESEVKRLSGAELIIQHGRQIGESIDGEAGLLVLSDRVAGELQMMHRLDDSAKELLERFQNLRTELREFERDLTRHVGAIQIDEDRLTRLRDDLAEVARLERKYRRDDAGLVALLEEYQGALRGTGGDFDVEGVRAERELVEKTVLSIGKKLSESRKRASTQLKRQVSDELAELGMPGAQLEVSVVPHEPREWGLEQLEFLIASNRGDEPKPLRLVASGGELARITLVLKKLLRDRSGINVLVFDEVDAGVSGKVARAVGEKLKSLAKSSQVLCITHLAQVASLADRHLLVSKGGKTRVTAQIRVLSDAERVDEIARMLAGYEITPASRASARELISSKQPGN